MNFAPSEEREGKGKRQIVVNILYIVALLLFNEMNSSTLTVVDDVGVAGGVVVVVL